MDNASLLRSLKQRAKKEQEKKTSGSGLSKFVIFQVEDTRFALKAEQVREISFENEIYYVPFLPPYIHGYANRHGQPFTVYDVQMLFEQRKLESSTLLILDIQEDQLALLISDIEEIVKLPQDAIHPLASHDESARFFAHSITVDEQELFVLNVDTLLERLERDIEHV